MTAEETVTPASDQEIARMQRLIGLDFPVEAMQSIFARIASDAKTIAELRAEGQSLKTAIDDLRRTVTEASMRRHEEITALRAENQRLKDRLAEVEK